MTTLSPRTMSCACTLRSVVAAVVFLTSTVIPSSATAQDFVVARTAINAGQYQQGITILERMTSGASAPVEAMRLLLAVYLEVGRLDDAERAAARFSANSESAVAVANMVGEVHYARGRLAEAEASFRRAQAGGAPDSLRARLNLAILAFERGERDSAMQQFDHFIDVYNRGGNLTSDELTSVAIACRYMGLDTPVLFRDALRAFDRAIATDPQNMEPRVRVGELFLEKYNSPDAQGAFDEVLAINPNHPRALLGTALRRLADGHPGVDSMLTRALDANPSLVDAYVLRAKLRAGAEDYPEALVDVNRALSVDPTSPGALAVAAAIHFIRGDSAAHLATVGKVLERNPRSAELFVTLAELAGRNRLYREAQSFAQRAVDLDNRHWPGWVELGINQMRTGAIADGRSSLEAAFAGDPYNVLVKNTLDLMDTFTEYDTIDRGRFQLMIAKQESALLSLYALDLLERAYDSLSARYQYTPTSPVRVEFYRRHADFSVRTVGLTGIGALGVSFGPVLALDSPTGRSAPYNWGTVLWHELAHTFTLGVTNNKVPRWFSEGLSVYEERRAGIPGWGADVTAEFLKAYKAGILAKVSNLSDGFMRPAFPEQVIFSYYQASLVCEMIVRDHGERAINAMLAAYRDGAGNEEVFRRVLNATPEQLDEKFDSYVRTRFREALENVGEAGVLTQGRGGAVRVAQQPEPGPYDRALADGVLARESGNSEEALRHFRRAISLIPDIADEGGAYVQVAMILAERSDFRGAAEQLARHNAINENSHATLIAESDYWERAGDLARAAQALERSMYIFPFDLKSHERLADLASRTGNKGLAVRERRAVVALRPVDMAEAYYQLALALAENGDNAGARREVLRALEEAPNFARAQELLLKVRGGTDGTD